MAEDDWDGITREVVSHFTALKERTPLYMVCLNWNLVSKDFLDDEGWMKWSNDGDNITAQFLEDEAVFIIFSRLGVHQMVYSPSKKPRVKRILAVDELYDFKLIKTGEDEFEMQIERDRDLILGKVRMKDTVTLHFEPVQWQYIELRRHMIIGRDLVQKEVEKKIRKKKKGKGTRKISAQVPTVIKATNSQRDEMLKRKAHELIKPHVEIVDDYEESIKSAESDIRALKKREHKRLAKDALERMRDDLVVIRRCDRDVATRNRRVKNLRKEKRRLKGVALKKMDRKVKMDELDRKIAMIDRMNEKELMIKTQKVTEFCGLREAILAIRAKEQSLDSDDINRLIEKAMMSDAQIKDLEEKQKKLDSYKK